MMDSTRKPTASRTLHYSVIGETTRHPVTIRIVGPYLLTPGSVAFEFDEGTAGCDIEFDGLPQKTISVYGADTLQALQMAVDIDPYLRGLSRTYEFFYDNGDAYLDD